jgi:hypothetical protein
MIPLMLITFACQTPGQTKATLPEECLDLRHFPAQESLADWESRNAKYRDWCWKQANFDPRRQDQYLECYYEAWNCYRRYEALERAQRCWKSYVNATTMCWNTLQLEYYQHYLQALHELQALLGSEDFALGQLGPVLPLWLLSRN